MNPLILQQQFSSLSLKDLLFARDLYHWHLSNKANVVGTAVGLYLIRKDDPWPQNHGAPQDPRSPRPSKPVRTFANSEVRPYSWPAIVVLVNNWVDAAEFGSGLDPAQMVPRTLYLPDGRSVPVCVVAVRPGETRTRAPADVRWPASYIGGGCPLTTQVQGVERQASVGCLVTDGHLTYALTNRHVCGEAGTPVSARLHGNTAEVGVASSRQLTREKFTDVFPGFAGDRCHLTLDVGLVEVRNVNDWTSQPFGLEGDIGEIVDLNELSLTLRFIDQPVVAFGSASGALDGKIKALFYRHKSLAGYDYISQFLIAPHNETVQTQAGDSGTVWHLKLGTDDAPKLHPLALEWGGQGLVELGGTCLNYALATGLSTVCQLLDVDIVHAHNTGSTPFWGQVGHYSIATAAIELVKSKELSEFLKENTERISFIPSQLTPTQIGHKLANGSFVELADVPDLVWKKLRSKVVGGRDYALNQGPEHPNHYADIDEPGVDGNTLRDLTLQGKEWMDVDKWRQWYEANGHNDPRSQGLLPFRVWQIFDEMVRRLQKGDDTGFLCAAGILAHYVGDACQPLHGSYRADGYRDKADKGAKTWPGKGIHAAFEDKMIDRHADELLSSILVAAKASKQPIPQVVDGREAAFATVRLMEQVADVIRPTSLIDTYIQLGGGGSAHVLDGLWQAFDKGTAEVMGLGASYLATLWEAAFATAGTPLTDAARQVPEQELATLYQDEKFLPSYTLEQIRSVLQPSQAIRVPEELTTDVA